MTFSGEQRRELAATQALARSSTSLTALAVVAFLAAANAGLAQNAAGENAVTATEPSGETVLDRIVLTGSRAPEKISEIARTIKVVDEAQIKAAALQGKSLQQILAETVPSFDAASEGSRTSYGQNLRGRTALVLIDGVSLNSARGLSRQFDSIDPFNIARVEVLSGATALYGGNATGGIINIITKKGRDAGDGLHAETQVGIVGGFQGSQDLDRNAAGAVTYNSANWDARLSVSGNRTGAYYDGSGEMVTPDITQSSTAFNKRIDVMGSVGVQIDENRRLDATMQYFDSAQDSDYGLYYGSFLSGLTNPRLFEARSGYSSDVEPQTRRKMLTLSYTDADFFGQQLLLQGAARSEDIVFNPFPSTGTAAGTYFGASQQKTEYYSFKAAIVSELTDTVTLTYGVDADRDSLSADQSIFNLTTAVMSGGLDFDTIGITGLYPDIDVSTIAGFTEVSWEATDRLTVSGGLRYQFAKTEVGDFVGAAQQVAILNRAATSADAIPGGDVNYDALLVNAGATYDVTPDQQIYANFSQGFELPDPAKYYGVGTYKLSNGHYVLNNSVNVSTSALEAIKTDSFEVGFRHDDGSFNVTTAAYYSTSDRSISLNRTTLTIGMNDEKRRVYGIEAEAGYKFDNGFDVGLLGHWVKSEKKGANGWYQESVGTASTSKAGGHIGWGNEAFSVRLTAEHVFSLEDDAGYEIEGYNLFNLGGRYTFAEQATTINFGIQNLFDTDYTTVWGSRAKALYGGLVDESVFDYQGRGRTFAISITKVF
ncbi:TonB-dependent receptor [Allorhizobium pseudoryzae]|uniref:TonB-dependent receptor n=1 Tax=Allorhizobium pseudoryzae TaxID=379684 RepID=UPI003CFE893C